MTVTVEELERLYGQVALGDVFTSGGDAEWRPYGSLVEGDILVSDLIALAIHGLNCQAAGITAERLAEGSVPHWPAELKARPAEELWAITKARLLEPETDQERIARKVRPAGDRHG